MAATYAAVSAAPSGARDAGFAAPLDSEAALRWGRWHTALVCETSWILRGSEGAAAHYSVTRCGGTALAMRRVQPIIMVFRRTLQRQRQRCQKWLDFGAALNRLGSFLRGLGCRPALGCRSSAQKAAKATGEKRLGRPNGRAGRLTGRMSSSPWRPWKTCMIIYCSAPTLSESVLPHLPSRTGPGGRPGFGPPRPPRGR